MKTALGIATLLLALASPALGDESVRIQFVKNPNVPAHRTVTEYVLRRTGEGFRCRTEGVPEHRIKVRGLESLKSPIKAQKVGPDCQSVIVWGRSRSCYDPQALPMIEEFLRECSSF